MIHNTTINKHVNMTNVTSFPDEDETLIFTNGKQAGSVHGDTFRRTLKPQHFLRYPKISIALSQDVISQLQALAVQELQFRNAETRMVYRCSLAHFVQAGRLIDRGYGTQIALALEDFRLQDDSQESKPKQDAKPKLVQLSFLGGLL